MAPAAPGSPTPKAEAESEKNAAVLGSSGKMDSEGKVAPDGKPVPLPNTPAPTPRRPAPNPRAQVLPTPHVEIEDVATSPDGKTQDIAFSLKLPQGVKLEHLAIDGVEASIPANGSFKLRLPLGPHTVHIEYGSASADLHDEVTQELMVDADQVKVIRPKTRITPPVKVPGADQVDPADKVPSKPKDAAAEKFDKKTA